MRRLCLSLAFLACAISAAQAAHPVRGKCVLQVKGVSYIDGPCDIYLEKDGNFQIHTIKGRLYFADVSLDRDASGTADGFWNGTIPGADHAHTHLGTLTRQDGCWVNEQAKICAWRGGKLQR